MDSTTTHAPVSGTPIRSAGQNGALLVVLPGLVSTTLALVGVYLLNVWDPEIQIMGRYVCYVIPYGAILVGVVASSGYGLGSWKLGVKISGAVMAGIVGLQLLAYFAAQYLEFVSLALVFDDGTPVDFLSYFHWTTTSFAWQQDDGTLGAPLGALGYGIRALELAGFAAGSLAVPALLRSKAYCDGCARYMASRGSRWLAASVAAEKIKKRDVARRTEHEQAQQAAFEEATARVQSLVERGAAGDASGFVALMGEQAIDARRANAFPVRIEIQLAACPGCAVGELRARLYTGFGDAQKTEEIVRVALRPHFVDEVSR